MTKSNQSPQFTTLLEKDSIADLAIKLQFKSVYYCVFFSRESNLLILYQRPESLIEYIKNVSYEFLIAFHIFKLR